ncbi:MAG: family 20 glycosylhydrolase [Hymenobacter sp.]
MKAGAAPRAWSTPKCLGHPALRAHGYYIDLYFSAASHYAADPLPVDTPTLPASRVLGGEAAMWSEFADSVLYESRVWPRAAGRSRAPLSPAALSQDVPDMYRRLAFVSEELAALGLAPPERPGRPAGAAGRALPHRPTRAANFSRPHSSR